MAHHWRVDRSFAITAEAEYTAWAAAQAHARGSNALDGNGYALALSPGQAHSLLFSVQIPNFSTLHTEKQHVMIKSWEWAMRMNVKHHHLIS